MTDARGAVLSQTHTEYFVDDNGTSRIETVTTAQGTVRNTYDNDGQLFASETVHSGANTLINAFQRNGPTLLSALTLLQAIQTGEPLPVLATGLRLAQHIDPGVEITGAANVASGILALMGLDAALERGDMAGAAKAGAAALHFGAQALADFAASQAFGAVSQGAMDLGESLALQSQAVADVAGTALSFLSVVNAMANEDETGMIVGTLALLPGMQWLGTAYAIVSLIDGLFGDGAPDPWGSGRFVWDGGRLTHQTAGEAGGEAAVAGVMEQTLATLNALIERARQHSPGSELGLIAQRLPGIAYDMSGFRYTQIDPLTGVERNPDLRFDTAGKPYNAMAGSPESYQSLVEAVERSALARGAIAPLWEVRTAQWQMAAGDPRAGLTEEERAAREGLLAAPLSGPTQVFRPVVLDLDGDGVETTAPADGVAFDVDGSGYLKQTAWVRADDGLLVLDRDANGQFDSGRELFSNAALALSRRGLGALAWIDANADGRLNAADPVWGSLRLWRDHDQDGQQDAGEVLGLDALGVSEIHHTMGTFTQNGEKKQLASPDLVADREGTRVSVVPEGIVVQSSADGHLSLVVTRIEDQSAVQANRDGLTGYEDVELIVGAADLLANDTLGGVPATELRLTGLTRLRHGSGFIDANGLVHFTPEPDYAGSDAGFDYLLQSAQGQTGTATVDVTVLAMNDAPTLARVDHVARPVYGHTYQAIGDDSEGAFAPVADKPLYEPHAIDRTNGLGGLYGMPVFNPPPDQPHLEYHLTPIAWEDTGAGRVWAQDVDDPATSLTVALASLPQYGTVQVQADGHFQYTSWKAPGVPSDRLTYEGQYAAASERQLFYPGNLPPYALYPTTDVFQVRITDPQGASRIESVSVPHLGPYTPTTPSGGGKMPIAVDLDGNGFEFVDLDDSPVFFDVNGDGWRRRTAWVGAGDGLLAFDSNGDGRIDRAGEIGFVRYRAEAQTDLQGLAAFDTDGDGVLSAADDDWDRFGVWQDRNQDGLSDAGEFRGLDQWGVTSVRLQSDGRFQVIDGQTVHGVGAMTPASGGTLALADVTLAYSHEALVRRPDGSLGAALPPPPAPGGETLDGSDGDDLLLGRHGDTGVGAGGGDDLVFDDQGNDRIDGGDGDDTIWTGADDDLVFGGAGDDAVWAGAGNDLLFGGGGHDALLAGFGHDRVFGGDGNDLIAGGWGNDLLSGDGGDDQLFGEQGADVLFGRAGNDTLSGGPGDDHYYHRRGDGLDALDDEQGTDTVVLVGALSLDQVALRVAEANGVATAQLRWLDADGSEHADQGFDFTLTRDASGQWTSPIEHFQLADGSVRTWEELRVQRRVAPGAAHQTEWFTGRDDDIVWGSPHGDTIRTGTGHDAVFAGNGKDRVQGDGGNNALFGGHHDDQLIGGDGHDFLAGGKHDDQLWTGGGHNVVAFNRGDGRDVVHSAAGASNVLSLGGGIRAQDLAFSRSGADLVLGTGGQHQVTLKDWYASAAQQTVDRLQLVSGDAGDGGAVGVDTHDFKALVRHFDAALQAEPRLSRWRLMDDLLDTHLGHTTDTAWGGELAIRYASGTTASQWLDAAPDVLSDPRFGLQVQGMGARPPADRPALAPA